MAKKPRLPFKMVLVEWIDAAHWQGWTDLDEEPDWRLKKCFTMGFLMQDEKDVIRLAQSISVPQVADVMCIPKPWVKRIVKL